MSTSHCRDNTTTRRLWQLTWPLLICSVTTPLLGIVDSAVVGHLSTPHYLAGVAIGSVIFSFIFRGFRFLRMGTTGITAQAAGRSDYQLSREHLGRAVLVASAIALLLMLLGDLIRHGALWLMDDQPIVSFYAGKYFDIRLYAAPATMLNYVLLGWFIGMQNTRIAMLIMVVTNVVNILLDLYLVTHSGWNIEGVATASVAAEYTGLSLGLFFLWRMLRKHPAPVRWREIFRLQPMQQLLHTNTHLFMRSLCLIMVFALIARRGAELGQIYLAANTLLLNFQSLSSFVLDGLAHAAEALSGRAAGAGRIDELRRINRIVCLWGLIIAVFFALIYALFGKYMVDLMTSLPSVRMTAHSYLLWVVVAPLISLWGVVYDGMFMGSLRSREMRNAMLISFFVVYLPFMALLAPLHNDGLWLALLAFMAVRGMLLARWFRRPLKIQNETP